MSSEMAMNNLIDFFGRQFDYFPETTQQHSTRFFHEKKKKF